MPLTIRITYRPPKVGKIIRLVGSNAALLALNVSVPLFSDLVVSLFSLVPNFSLLHYRIFF